VLFWIAEDFLEGMDLEFRGVGLGRAQDAKCCGHAMARGDGGVLEVAEKTWVDITCTAHEGDECGLVIEIEIEIVYNNTTTNRLLSLGHPCTAQWGPHATRARP
jgi:hypothetical protein